MRFSFDTYILKCTYSYSAQKLALPQATRDKDQLLKSRQIVSKARNQKLRYDAARDKIRRENKEQ